MVTILFSQRCSVTSVLNDTSICYSLNICRKLSWEKDCAAVESSLDMDAVVCVVSEFTLFMFADLVFLVSRFGMESSLSMS